jgi:hypothetical protein
MASSSQLNGSSVPKFHPGEERTPTPLISDHSFHGDGHTTSINFDLKHRGNPPVSVRA